MSFSDVMGIPFLDVLISVCYASITSSPEKRAVAVGAALADAGIDVL